jgi:formate dehydrogenase major subunit
MNSKTINSVCTYCGVGCEISAHIQNDTITKIRPVKDGKSSGGKLCIKGTNGHDFVSSPNRLQQARIKKSFIHHHELYFPKQIKEELKKYSFDGQYLFVSYELAAKITAWKLQRNIDLYGCDSVSFVGGARTNCESGYIFQKVAREVIGTPNVDNCARICHAPSLKGLRATIGEGAASNPFDDIFETENIIIIGSNTSQAHPMVAQRVIKQVKSKKATLSVFDIRDIDIAKYATHNCVIPYEANLLVLNMLAFVILNEKLYNEEFINTRTKEFETYKQSILNDEFANPEFFQKLSGYKHLEEKIKQVARTYATKKSLILWGLGITEHIDGSSAVAAVANLALLTGNIGKIGAGLMPLRGQNNVQGACDVGCLPYYKPGYQTPDREGLKTPDMIDAIFEDRISSLYVMGEDLAHVHANQNKIHTALRKLDFVVVNELIDNEITKYAHIVFGVKSAYEKEGIYVNAERRLHYSTPLVSSNLKDDWEVLQLIANYLGANWNYETNSQVWSDLRIDGHTKFKGARWEYITKNQSPAPQWPFHTEDTPTIRLHEKTFPKEDGKGVFRYRKYHLREMIKELLKTKAHGFYLSTGRLLEHYNNAVQTGQSQVLLDKVSEDIVLVSSQNSKEFENVKKNSPYLKIRKNR